MVHGLLPLTPVSNSPTDSDSTTGRSSPPGLIETVKFPSSRNFRIRNKNYLPFSGENTGSLKPSYLNFNLWFRRNAYDVGVQVANSGEGFSNRTLKGVYQYNLSKDFWFKASLDNKFNHDAYTYLNWNGVQLGFSVGLNVKNNEGFDGYLDYPFNWGLSLKFSA